MTEPNNKVEAAQPAAETVSEKRESTVFEKVAFTFAMLVLLVVLYLASAGPVAYCFLRNGVYSGTLVSAFEKFYTPAEPLYRHWPTYKRYVDWWTEKAKP